MKNEGTQVTTRYEVNDCAIGAYGSELAGDCLKCKNCGKMHEEHESTGVCPEERKIKLQVRSIGSGEAVEGLLKIFDGLQEDFHDQWNWTDAYFFVDVLKTLAIDRRPE